jgi:2-polyprenyl-3-methyl-5-hydroxy-6-metoxy-1,4-benzoquinol methylase
MTEKTRERQYQLLLEMREQYGLGHLGLMSSQTWAEDPRRLAFVLARYKFVAKMLSGKERVLEVGCADAFGTRIVQQEVKSVTAVDFDPVFIESVRQALDPRWPLALHVHDMLAGPLQGPFDAGYALDVLEHIRPVDEEDFVRNLAGSLTDAGVAIFGMPSIESQAYASRHSREGHVNCKTGIDFKRLMERHFASVFLFSMNDEVVHTGFYKMAHYLLVLCCQPLRPATSTPRAASS